MAALANTAKLPIATTDLPVERNNSSDAENVYILVSTINDNDSMSNQIVIFNRLKLARASPVIRELVLINFNWIFTESYSKKSYRQLINQLSAHPEMTPLVDLSQKNGVLVKYILNYLQYGSISANNLNIT